MITSRPASAASTAVVSPLIPPPTTRILWVRPFSSAIVLLQVYGLTLWRNHTGFRAGALLLNPLAIVRHGGLTCRLRREAPRRRLLAAQIGAKSTPSPGNHHRIQARTVPEHKVDQLADTNASLRGPCASDGV